MREPITIPANFELTPSSSKVLRIIVVEEIERITPKDAVHLFPAHPLSH
jgi:hypothetical protein